MNTIPLNEYWLNIQFFPDLFLSVHWIEQIFAGIRLMFNKSKTPHTHNWNLSCMTISNKVKNVFEIRNVNFTLLAKLKFILRMANKSFIFYNHKDLSKKEKNPLGILYRNMEIFHNCENWNISSKTGKLFHRRNYTLQAGGISLYILKCLFLILVAYTKAI